MSRRSNCLKYQNKMLRENRISRIRLRKRANGLKSRRVHPVQPLFPLSVLLPLSVAPSMVVFLKRLLLYAIIYFEFLQLTPSLALCCSIPARPESPHSRIYFWTIPFGPRKNVSFRSTNISTILSQPQEASNLGGSIYKLHILHCMFNF